jgi:hypothetical protein
VEGLDENVQKHIYNRAKKLRNTKPTSNTDSKTTASAPDRQADNTEQRTGNKNKSMRNETSMSKTPTAVLDSDTQHLMPSIYTLRGITPGGIPKPPDVPTAFRAGSPLELPK